MKVSIDEKSNEMVIRIPLLNEPRESASKKTMVVATTSGNVVTDCKFKDKQIVVGLNAYFKK